MPQERTNNRKRKDRAGPEITVAAGAAAAHNAYARCYEQWLLDNADNLSTAPEPPAKGKGKAKKFNAEKFACVAARFDPGLRIKKLLGKGSYGHVYAAEMSGARGRPVAIKGERIVGNRRLSLRQELAAYTIMFGNVSRAESIAVSGEAGSSTVLRDTGSTESSSSASTPMASSSSSSSRANQQPPSSTLRDPCSWVAEVAATPAPAPQAADTATAVVVRPKRVCYPGIPHMLVYWSDNKNYRAMVFDRMGPSLKELLKRCGGKFSAKSCAFLAIQLLEHLEFTHDCGLVHRDLKPANVVVGYTGSSSSGSGFSSSPPGSADKGLCAPDAERYVYLIDFGLSKLYVNPDTGQHLPHRMKRGHAGTLRFMSLATHMGHEVSRRDDLQSLAYVLVYCLKGRLPWQDEENAKPRRKLAAGIPGAADTVAAQQEESAQKHERVYRMKRSTSAHRLCRGAPSCFRDFASYALDLGFDQRPDYANLRALFQHYLATEEIPVDFAYDWIKLRA